MPDVLEVNLKTGEVTERPYTPEEKAQRDKDSAEALAREAEEKAKADDRDKDIKMLKDRAKTDPDFAALLRVMGYED